MTKIVNAVLGRDKNAVKPIKDFSPSGIRAGGFNIGGRETVEAASSPERQALISNVSSLFNKQASEVSGLRSMVAPGFSQLRKTLGGVQSSRLAQIDDSRTKAIGNLRENLARRRVLGSSFGQDAISRSEAEFSRQRDQVIAETGFIEAQTTLQELEATRSLISEEFNLARGSVQVFLDDLNVEAQIATQLATNATSALASNAQVQSQILQRQVDNTQSFLTELIGVGLGSAGAKPSAFGGA